MQLILCLCVLSLLSGFLSPGNKKTLPNPAENKPNIILIIADDLTWIDSAPYGNTEVRTPKLTQLAKEGMTFYGMHTATAMRNGHAMKMD